MAFNINAQVILSGPKNLGKISKQIQTSLGKSGAIKVKIDSSSLRNIKILNSTVGTLNTNIASLNSSASKLQSTLNGVNRNLSKASSATSSFSKSQSNTASSIKNVNNALQQQNQQLGNLGKRFLSTAKTAIAFGLISRPIYDLQRAFIGATKDAVAFEREIVKISQVTGQTVKQLGNLRNDINRLSTSLGISANELAETSRIIAQTGKTAQETRVILEALSRSTLAPTFGSITDTTEGLVAALGQFNLEAKDSEAILGALNRVSKNFAVEAEDLISVIRRTGGVFAQAAGDSRNTIGALEELISIFTAVRSTTRESADTIAAGLRTIFSRIQRRGTIEFLEQFGVQLTNAKGQFIGVFPAFDELSRKLDSLIKQGDALTLSAIAEELGGIRQIGKLLPAIAQFDKARAALEEAQKGAVEGLSGDVAKGLDTIDNRLKRVGASFNELIRTVFESPAFQNFAKTILTVSEQLLSFSTSIVKFIEPILPLLATLGAVKLGGAVGGLLGGGGLGQLAGAVSGQATAANTAQAAVAAQQSVSIEQQMLSVLNQVSTQLSNIFSLQSADNKLRNNQLSNIFQAINRQAARSAAPTVVGGFGGPRRRASGGQIYGFNRGGMVPGTGNRDTVPAMLTPGEFVIKKSSVESIGAGTLASMNKFNDGGAVARLKPDVVGGLFLQEKLSSRNTDFEVDAPQGKKIGRNNIGKIVGKINTATLQPEASAIIGEETRSSIKDAIANSTLKSIDTLSLPAPLNFNPQNAIDSVLKRIDFNTLEGYVFEGFIGALSNLTLSESEAGFDFPSLSQRGVSRLLEAFQPDNNIRNVKLLEAKRTLSRGSVQNASNSIANKILTAAGSPLLPSSDFTITRVGSGPLSPDEEQELSELEAQRKKKGFLGQKSGKRFDALRARRGFNSGGGISGQDTVPALLTPGEFVFNKKAASRIGYGNLNTMNKQGVVGFNKGGVVGFKNGGMATGGAGIDIGALSGALFSLQFAFQDVANIFSGEGQTFGSILQTLITVGTSLAFTLQAINAQQLAQGFNNLLGGIKNLPKTLKGFDKTFRRLGTELTRGKSLQNISASFKTGGLGRGPDAALNKAIGRVTGSFGKLSSFLGKQTTGKGITAALSKGLLNLGPQAGKLIGGALATGAATAIASAASAGTIGAAVGKGIGDLIERFTAGPVEEIAGFRGREGGRTGSRQVTGALSGALGGAAAGAAIGGPIGAAIGAAIGGGAGLIVASINGPLEDAAFAAAKKLQKSSESLGKSLDNLDKDFSVASFEGFLTSINNFQNEVASSTETFQKKFTEEVTFNNLFRTNRGDFRKTLQSLGELIDPKQVQKARDALNQGLESVVKTLNIDVSSFENYNDFLEAINKEAAKGNKLAKDYTKALEKQYDLELTSRAAELTKLDKGISVGGFKGRDLGPALLQLREAAQNAGEDLSNMSKNEIQLFVNNVVAGSQAFKDSVAEITDTLNKMSREQQRLAGIRAKTNLLLAQGNAAINKFVAQLNDIGKAIDVTFNRFDARVANFNNNAESLAGAITDIKVFSEDEPGDFQNRNIALEGLSTATGASVDSLRNFNAVVGNSSQIAENALKELENLGTQTLSPEELQKVLIKKTEEAFGGNLSGPLRKGLSDIFEGIGRQFNDGKAFGLDALREAIAQGTFTEEFIKAFGPLNDTVTKLIESYQKLIDITQQQAKAQFDLLQAQTKTAREIAKRERAISDTQLDPEKQGRDFFGRREDEVTKAQNDLSNDLKALTGSTDNSVTAIQGRIEADQERLRQVREDIAAGGGADITELRRQRVKTTDPEERFRINEEIRRRQEAQIEEEARLASNIANNTEALRTLSEATTILAAAQQKANRLIENRSRSRALATNELVARETGDFISLAKIRENAQVVAAGLAPGASREDQTRLLVRGSQDQAVKEEIALQERIRDRKGSFGKTSQQIFDDLLIKNIDEQLARTDLSDTERARLEQQKIDIEAGDLDDLTRQSVSIQEQQLLALRALVTGDEKLRQEVINGINQERELANISVNAEAQNTEDIVASNTQAPAPAPPQGAAPGQFANGGLVYANKGMLIPYEPKGTDTVPAMLTPGEFVMKKSAVDKYGAGTMSAVNNGTAQIYAQEGTFIERKFPGLARLLRGDFGSLGKGPNLAADRGENPTPGLDKMKDDLVKQEERVTGVFNNIAKNITAERDAKRKQTREDLSKMSQSFRDSLNSTEVDKSTPITSAFGIPISRTPSGALKKNADIQERREKVQKTQAAQEEKIREERNKAALENNALRAEFEEKRKNREADAKKRSERIKQESKAAIAAAKAKERFTPAERAAIREGYTTDEAGFFEGRLDADGNVQAKFRGDINREVKDIKAREAEQKLSPESKKKQEYLKKYGVTYKPKSKTEALELAKRKRDKDRLEKRQQDRERRKAEEAAKQTELEQIEKNFQAQQDAEQQRKQAGSQPQSGRVKSAMELELERRFGRPLSPEALAALAPTASVPGVGSLAQQDAERGGGFFATAIGADTNNIERMTQNRNNDMQKRQEQMQESLNNFIAGITDGIQAGAGSLSDGFNIFGENVKQFNSAIDRQPGSIEHFFGSALEVNGLNALKSLADGLGNIQQYLQNASQNMTDAAPPEQGDGLSPKSLR